MPVNTRHKAYEEAQDRWSRCRDCYDGSDAVKEAGEKYLPALDSHQIKTGNKAYEAYKTRALFFNATGRTVDGFAGAVFQKEPIIKLEPEPVVPLGPDGKPLPLGPDGKPLAQALGPDGKPLPPKLGPDGKPLPPTPAADPAAAHDALAQLTSLVEGHLDGSQPTDAGSLQALLGQMRETQRVAKSASLAEAIRVAETASADAAAAEAEGKQADPSVMKKLLALLKKAANDIPKAEADDAEMPPELDDDGKPIEKTDPEGNPIKDKKQPFPPKKGAAPFEKGAGDKKPKLGPDGKPIQKLGPDGKPIQKLGPDGKPMVDEATGEPMFEEEEEALPAGDQLPEEKPKNPIEKHLKDITLTGQTFDMFGFETLQEVLTTGRYGILIDMADTELREKQRPYWAGYDAETIINWSTDRIEGEEKLIRVVLCENAEVEDPDDPFETKEEERYRVLVLEEDEEFGGRTIYKQQVWERKAEAKKKPSREDQQKAEAKARGEFVPYSESESRQLVSGEPTKKAEGLPKPGLKSKKPSEWELVEEIIPVRRGEPLDFIPFYFINSAGAQSDVTKPPLLDLVDVNLSHYRTSADLEHGRHFSGLPTPWISGAPTNQSNEIQLGPGGMLILEKGGQAGMLEAQTSFPSLEKADEDKRKMMAILGARLLEEQSGVPETLGAVGMRHSGEQAVLRTIVQVLEQQLTRALRVHVWWMGTEKTPEDLDYVDVALNKDFFAVRMRPDELASLLAALQADAISYKTFYHNLSIGGITRPGVTEDEEQTEISNKPDTAGAAMPNAPDAGQLNSMIYNNQLGTPKPNPQFGKPGQPPPGQPPPPPKGVVPPGLAASAAAAKAASKKRRTISVERDANGRASAYRIS